MKNENVNATTTATESSAAVTMFNYVHIRWDSKTEHWDHEEKHVPMDEFHLLDGAVQDANERPKALTKDAPCFVSVNAYEAYCDTAEHLQTSLSVYGCACKRHDAEKAKEALVKVFANMNAYLSLFGRDWVADQLFVDALLMHVGTYRKVDESQWAFMPVGKDTFRKSLERTMANRIGKGDIRTYAEVKAARKAKELARKAAKKAAKEAAAAAQADVQKAQ